MILLSTDPPPVPAIASPGENELFVYNIGGDPVQVPILVTGQAEEGYPITDFSISVTDRGDVTAASNILGLNSIFVTGAITLDYTDGGIYDITVAASNSVGDAFTSSPFEVFRHLPALGCRRWIGRDSCHPESGALFIHRSALVSPADI